MRIRPALLFILILTLNACRLWREDADRRSPPGTETPEPEQPPATPMDPNDQPDPDPSLPKPEARTILLDYQPARDRLDLEALKNRLQFPAVTAPMIIDAFQKKAAPHPRILANREDFTRMKQLLSAQDPYVLTTVATLKKAAENYLKEPVAPYQWDDANLRLKAPHATQEAIAVLSLLYQLTGNSAYANKVRDHLLNYARFSSWNDAKHFLDTGIMSYSVALGFDWTYDRLTAEERRIISSALIDKGIRPYLARATPSAFWYQSRNNWNPICNGGVSLAAMAVMDSSAEAKQLGADVLARALQAVPFYIREFEPDGQTVEGMMYWDYGLSNLIRWTETLKRTLGTDYRASETPGLKAAGFFPVAVSGPVTGISLGDDPLKITRSGTSFWFAKRYNSPALARYHANEVKAYGKYSWMDLLFYDPKLVNAGGAGTQDLPLDRYVRDLEYVSFRSSWDHNEALYVGIHAGDNRASHGHLDAGTFFVQGKGQVWAIGGLGSDNYTFPGYFSKETLPAYKSPTKTVSEPGRFHMYRLRAEGKNTLVLNPDPRPDQNPEGKAEIERILTQPGDAMAIINLSGVYDRDASSVRRGLGLRQKRQTVLVQDEIKMKTPGRVWWSMHTTAAVELQQDGRVAILKKGGQNLWLEIQSPARAGFVLRDASYLPGLSFPLSKNSPNTFQGDPVKKLTITLDNVSAATLSVGMKLVTDTRSAPGFPAFAPLDDWAERMTVP
ncbi:MAG TPA: hypothetical protein VFO10_17770 [Oligoflexus sp.]|uniref:hypothetical protein n=1 Tax=Oligoflexus sp. TaxID=1971216 RepID=UPI002D7EDCD1|nr:hypothetical protein [Oligoflexus sp.]HET9239112.1 hypothetical protein [Oligoflexus sp.]